MTEYILDTGALLSTWTQKLREVTFLTTSSVIDEVENRPSKTRVDTLISVGRLSIREPSQEFVKRAKKMAVEYGDAATLSPTDLEVLALALEHKEQTEKTVVVSVDLAVLNTASHLGLEIIDPSGRMKAKIKWIYQCPACGHMAQDVDQQKACPVCGTEMRRRAVKRQHM